MAVNQEKSENVKRYIKTIAKNKVIIEKLRIAMIYLSSCCILTTRKRCKIKVGEKKETLQAQQI